MRILMLAQFFPPDIGGEERHVQNLGAALVARGHDVAVATHAVPGLPLHEVLPSGVRVHRIPTAAMRLPGVYASARQHHPPMPDPEAARALRRVLAAERPDVVHAHNWIVNSVLPVLGRGAERYPLVLTLHDYSQVCATKRLMRDGKVCAGPSARCLPCASAHYGPLTGPAIAAATAAMRPWKARAADHVVSVSHSVAQRNGVDAWANSSVVPNFVPDELLTRVSDPAAPRLPAEAGDLIGRDYLFFAGDLSPDKGLAPLLAAYESLGPDRPALLMVGRPGPGTPTDLPKGARICREWAHEDVLEAFAGCRAAVLPSVWPDPCPTTVLEAMASGRPVVTTAIGGMLDMVVPDESGLLVAPDDADALGAAIRRVLADPDLATRLGRAGRERVTHFTASAVAARLEDIYYTVAAGRAGTPELLEGQTTR